MRYGQMSFREYEMCIKYVQLKVTKFVVNILNMHDKRKPDTDKIEKWQSMKYSLIISKIRMEKNQ